MAKIKYDLTDVDPETSKAWGGGGEQPKPGTYRYKIKEINPGFSKNRETGEPDRKRPRLEIVMECLDARYRGSPVWEYISFSDGHKPKLDQFLMAVGVVTEKSKRKGEFDPKKIEGKTVTVRIRAGKNQDGEYRAEVGSIFPDKADAEDLEDDELTDDDEIAEDDDELMEDDSEELDDDDEEIEEEESDRASELDELKVDDLKPIAKDLGIKLAGHNKASLIEAIVEAEEEQETEEVDDSDDDDELLDDDEEIIEEDEEESGDYLTREELEAMDSKQLVATSKEFDITIEKGTKKGALIDMILEAQAAPDDEVPF